MELECLGSGQHNQVKLAPFSQTTIGKSNVIDPFIYTMKQQSVVLFPIKIIVIASISNIMGINSNNCTLHIVIIMVFYKFDAFLFLYLAKNVIYFWHLYLTKFEFTWMIFLYLMIIYGSYDKWYPIISLQDNLLNIKWGIIILSLIFDLKIEIVLLQHDSHILKYKNTMEIIVNNVKYYQFIKCLIMYCNDKNDIVLLNFHVILLVARNNANKNNNYKLDNCKILIIAQKAVFGNCQLCWHYLHPTTKKRLSALINERLLMQMNI